ncbi:MAG: hypothetical protein QW240_06010 [Candidatus Caldarchaeum sp.]
MQPLVVFALVLLSFVAGMYFFGGRSLSLKNLTPTAGLTSFFLFSSAAFQASARGTFSETLIALIVVVSLLIPAANYLYRKTVQKSRSQIFLRTIFLYLSTAVVLRALQDSNLHPILLIAYGAAVVINSKVYQKIGSTASHILTTVIAITSLILATSTTPETIPAELLPAISPALLLAFASFPRDVLDKADTSMIVVLSTAMIFVISSIFLSPLVEAGKPVTIEIGLDFFLILAMVFASIELSGKSYVNRLSEAPFFAAAAALAFAGLSLNQSLALLLTPLTGFPTMNLTSQLFQYVAQFFGLAAVFTLLKRVVELSPISLKKIVKENSFSPQLSAVVAMLFALLASFSTDLTTLLSLAGSVNLIIFSAILPSISRRKLVLVPSTVLFLVAANIILFYAVTEMEAVIVFGTPNILKLVAISVSAAATAVGAWIFAGNASAPFRRKQSS